VMKNKLLIAVAGSGKTTKIVNDALEIKNSRVLITTFTEINTNEIIHKVIDKANGIPSNIDILPWFSFLLRDGLRPYQSLLIPEIHDDDIGFLMVNGISGRMFGNKKYSYSKKNPLKYYLSETKKKLFR